MFEAALTPAGNDHQCRHSNRQRGQVDAGQPVATDERPTGERHRHGRPHHGEAAAIPQTSSRALDAGSAHIALPRPPGATAADKRNADAEISEAGRAAQCHPSHSSPRRNTGVSPRTSVTWPPPPYSRRSGTGMGRRPNRTTRPPSTFIVRIADRSHRLNDVHVGAHLFVIGARILAAVVGAKPNSV
jgi:hypothetical protein